MKHMGHKSEQKKTRFCNLQHRLYNIYHISRLPSCNQNKLLNLAGCTVNVSHQIDQSQHIHWLINIINIKRTLVPLHQYLKVKTRMHCASVKLKISDWIRIERNWQFFPLMYLLAEKYVFALCRRQQLLTLLTTMYLDGFINGDILITGSLWGLECWK